jgi:hypothetical protein
VRIVLAATSVVAALVIGLSQNPGVATAASATGVTPSAITISDGAVCTATSGGQTYPVSITLPTPFVNQKVDVALLLDDTGSFESQWSTVSSTFSSVVDQLQAAAPGVSFGFGVSMFKDYGGNWSLDDGDSQESRPFILNQPIVTAADAGGSADLDTLISTAVASANVLPGDGGDSPEAAIEGLDQVATGAGLDGDANGSKLDSGPAGNTTDQQTPGVSGDVPPFSSNVATTSGSLGGIGWRPGALHIVILATDVATVAAFPSGGTIPATIVGANGDSEPTGNFAASSLTPGDSRTGFVSDSTDFSTNTVTGAVAPLGGATVQQTVNDLNGLGIRVLGMGPGAAPTASPGPAIAPSVWLSSIARLTGATDATDNPLVFDDASAGLGASIVSNLETSAGNPVDVAVKATGAPAGVTATATPSVVTGVAPGGTASFNVAIESTTPNPTGSFTLDFVDNASGAELGSIPVTLDCGSTPTSSSTTTSTSTSTSTSTTTSTSTSTTTSTSTSTTTTTLPSTCRLPSDLRHVKGTLILPQHGELDIDLDLVHHRHHDDLWEGGADISGRLDGEFVEVRGGGSKDTTVTVDPTTCSVSIHLKARGHSSGRHFPRSGYLDLVITPHGRHHSTDLTAGYVSTNIVTTSIGGHIRFR